MKKIVWSIVAAALPLLTFGDPSFLPQGVKNTQNPKDETILPQTALERITVPEGFKTTLFAGEPDVMQPIAMTFDDRGRLWVAENYSHPVWKPEGQDRIVIYEDQDQDGVFDQRKVFYEGLNYLSGLEVGFGGVYVCNVPELLYIPDLDGDDVPDGPPVPLLDGWSKQSRNNMINNLTWGPDGWLYGCVGQNGGSLVGKPGTPKEHRIPHSRGLWRFHPTSHDFQVVAYGPVNPWGLDFNELGEGFFVNCVLPHLWQMIPGAHYQRRTGEKDNPYAYERMASITDHLHWGGGNWTSSRGGQGIHHTAGGGHAHTGAMIYLGNNWPDAYRHTIFMGNIHGNRLNNDSLERHGSGYVARHRPDFLHGNHPWFRSLTQKYGPDGGVFISDWHDFGECHDNDGSHRSSGRIYKIVYGQPNPLEPFDLQKASLVELVKLQTHRNEWFPRHARRILQERAWAGEAMEVAHRELWALLQDSPNLVWRLRGFWGLWVTGGISENQMMELTIEEEESIRTWAVRFLCENRRPTPRALTRLAAMARSDKSSQVRMTLASIMQSIPVAARMPLVEGLLRHDEDAEDQNIPLLLWYGMEPLVPEHPEKMLQLTADSSLRKLRGFTVRRMIDAQDLKVLGLLVQTVIRETRQEVQLDFLQGMLVSLRGRLDVQSPPGWGKLYDALAETKNPDLISVATSLAAVFKDDRALSRLRDLAADERGLELERRVAVKVLAEQQDPELIPLLFSLLEEEALRPEALKALSRYQHVDTPSKILDRYPDFSAEEKRVALDTLVSRPKYAVTLLEAIEAKQIPASEVPVHTVRHLQNYTEASIREPLERIWGQVGPVSEEKQALLARYREIAEAGDEPADPIYGRRIFQEKCAGCHKLFGEGGDIGPDLTGSGRADASYILENLLDPSALVTRAYQLATVRMKDGRLLSGMIRNETDKTLTLKTVDDELLLPRQQIRRIQTATQSMMPEGLLEGLSDQDIRDLLEYLKGSRQVPLD